ncbi:MAG TPA: ceramidase domain-containing protein [Pseudolabrys sp.]|nr:ceramidase domain-containing protein [Pseudolabrys sp.]
MWSESIDLYCERLGAPFWAEPVNALSNIAFLFAAATAFRLWRKDGGGDLGILALIAVVAMVALGSFAFHTIATRGAMLLDVVPIGIFIYGYFLFAVRRLLAFSWPLAVGLLAVFAGMSTWLAVSVPRSVLNGSSGYFPALAALLAIGWWTRARTAGKALLAAAGVFGLSLFFRIIDLDICRAIPFGTHFLWHILNAIVLYLVLRSAIAERTQAPAQA